MGNSLGPGSSSTKLQHLVRNKYSILSSVYSVDALRAVLTDLDGLCKDFENPDLAKSLGFKELRFGLQIVCELVDVSLQSAAVVSVPTKLLVLEALQSLLCIPQLARKAIEADGFLRLLSVLDPSSVELFIGTLGVILKVLTVLEEDNYNAIFFQTLSRLGCVQKFIIFVTHASVAGADNMLASAIVILDIVYWSFTHEHSSLVALRHTIRHAAFQHRDSLFELSRHPVRKLSYLTTMLLIKLMASEDKSTCLAIQVHCSSITSPIPLYSSRPISLYRTRHCRTVRSYGLCRKSFRTSASVPTPPAARGPSSPPARCARTL